MDSYGNEFVHEKKIPAVFPKALEPYDTKPIENDFGLTSTEVLSLKAGWAMIKKKQHQASLSTYVNLFTEHYDLYELFRDPQGHLNVQLAALHQKMVLHVFQLVIEHLNDARFVRSLLKDVASKHKKVPVSNYQWQLYTNQVKRYFVDTLSNFSSPSYVQALDKLVDTICYFNAIDN
ncbi:uncharacterized protein LOC129253418 [Anastrepha obliqua]|uniref:uncharacterized protein LOC129253418 n=1 Tax=Anastrepha obliqua TaxID=95512 RepID=UPI002408F28C|nr:uncharacterized protein LOC129253418 [Anastrepha obliqua]